MPVEVSTPSTRMTKAPSTIKPTARKTTPTVPITSTPPPPTSTAPTTSTVKTLPSTKSTAKSRNLTISRNLPRPPHTDSEESLIDRVDSVSLLPQDNGISDIANAKNSDSPDVNLPRNKIESGPESHKLNLGNSCEHTLLPIRTEMKNCYISGGIIALGVFGGFVFLSAIITTFFIAIRR